MSDWVCTLLCSIQYPSLNRTQGGVWGDAEFVNGGLDINMPGIGFGGELGSFWGDALLPYVENGTIPEWRLDDAVCFHPLVIPIAAAHT